MLSITSAGPLAAPPSAIQMISSARPRSERMWWFTIRIVHREEKIEGWLDGKKLLEAIDRTFPDAGGIGFWTKADAASSFDDLVVRSDARR